MPKQKELAGMEAPHFEDLEDAASAYVKVRDKRMRLTEEEIAAKVNLIAVAQSHAKEMTPNGDGELTYRFDDLVVVLKPGKVNVKVKTERAEDEEDKD